MHNAGAVLFINRDAGLPQLVDEFFLPARGFVLAFVGNPHNFQAAVLGAQNSAGNILPGKGVNRKVNKLVGIFYGVNWLWSRNWSGNSDDNHR